MRRLFGAKLVFLLPALALASGCGGAGGSPVDQAIDSIRGIDFETMDEAQRSAAYARLDGAWRVLMDHQQEALPRIREALDAETDDDYFLIDLSVLYLAMQPGPQGLAEAAGWLARADPNAYPSRFFEVASGMAAGGCEVCLPAALKMLELEGLEARVQRSNLAVDLDGGLLLTLVPFGDAALPGVAAALDDSRCVVRTNAARVLGMLLPRETPEGLRRMAEADSCAAARHAAWQGLAVLDPAAAVRIVARRREASPDLDEGEALAMVAALRAAAVPGAVAPLRALALREDSAAGARAVEALQQSDTWNAQLRGIASSRPQSREPLLAALDAAASTAEFRFGGKVQAMIAALSTEDFPRVDRARRAVLKRLSGEAVAEYRRLTEVATLQRRALGGAAPGT